MAEEDNIEKVDLRASNILAEDILDSMGDRETSTMEQRREPKVFTKDYQFLKFLIERELDQFIKLQLLPLQAQGDKKIINKRDLEAYTRTAAKEVYTSLSREYTALLVTAYFGKRKMLYRHIIRELYLAFTMQVIEYNANRIKEMSPTIRSSITGRGGKSE